MKVVCRHGHDTSVVGRTGNGTCRACHGRRTDRYARAHPELRREIQARYDRKRKAAHSQASRDRMSKKSPDERKAYYREHRLRALYGISTQQYETMLARQGGVCAICKRPARILHVDHDHRTGGVRELLCPRCNVRVAHVESELLTATIDYVQKWSGQ